MSFNLSNPETPSTLKPTQGLEGFEMPPLPDQADLQIIYFSHRMLAHLHTIQMRYNKA